MKKDPNLVFEYSDVQVRIAFLSVDIPANVLCPVGEIIRGVCDFTADRLLTSEQLLQPGGGKLTISLVRMSWSLMHDETGLQCM